MTTLRQYLDADWARFRELAELPASARSLAACLSSRLAPVMLIRVAQTLHNCNWKRCAKFASLINFVVFGLEVPASLQIDPGLVIMHTHGTVLGASRIGSNVTIYQQVTLGARTFDFAYTLALRPVVEDHVTITAGAKVLGALTLGRHCVVGANAVVLADVPPHALAVGVPARVIKRTESVPHQERDK